MILIIDDAIVKAATKCGNLKRKEGAVCMKAVILDDDPLILSLLSDIFHRRGYEVVISQPHGM